MRQPIARGQRLAVAAPSPAQARPRWATLPHTAPRRGGHCVTHAAERRYNRMAHLRRLWPLAGGTLQRWR
jgi:hypothetical protein